MNAAFASVGKKIDILVHNAAYLPDLEPIATSNLTEWWKGFEVNIKGSFVVTQAFIKNAAKDAVLIAVTTGVAHLPAFPDYSSYSSSKLGGIKFFDSVQAENPGLRVVSVHPGVIKSDMNDKSTAHGEVFPFDDGMCSYSDLFGLQSRNVRADVRFLASLPSDFIVWAASPEGKFLKGKTVWTNWDVDELKAAAGTLETSPALTLGLLGLFDTGFTSKSNPA